MSLGLEPAELGFKRPFNREVYQTLKLINSSALPIAFKVKTTAPKQYCVRPNSGKIESGGSVEVSVVLQPMKQDPAPDAKCRDKFLVQSITVPAAKEMPPWSELEKAPDFKAMVQERKIKVHYVPADGSDAPHVNGVDDSTIVDDSVLSPPPQYTPRGGQSTIEDPAPVAKSEPADSPNPAPIDEGLRRRQPDDSDSLAGSTIGSTTGSTVVSTGRNVGREEAPSKISRVKDTATAQLQQAPTVQGVPVPTVALLCLIVFLLTYFLF